MALALLVAVTRGADAQSQAELADRLNEEGKELMRNGDYRSAARKFQEATARVVEAKYYLNLCLARFGEGLYNDALTACHAANIAPSSPELKTKIDAWIAKIIEASNIQHHDVFSPFDGPHGPDPRSAHPPDSTRASSTTPPVRRNPQLNRSLASASASAYPANPRIPERMHHPSPVGQPPATHSSGSDRSHPR